MIFWCQGCGEQHTPPHVTQANITSCAKCGGSRFATWQPVRSALSQEAVREEVLENVLGIAGMLEFQAKLALNNGKPDIKLDAATIVPKIVESLRALKREPNAAGPAGQESWATPSHEGHAAGPAPAAPDVASMVRRPPSSEMVMVPREDLIRWASWFEEADSRIGPCWLGVKRDTSFKEAADEMRAHLGGTFKCPRCGVATPHQHNIDRKGNVMLSAAEAEGRKPYAHVIGACPLCGRTDPHSHTSGPLGMS